MAKLHRVKKARKDNLAVSAGEPYYWWQHAFQARQYSKRRPKPSQLTLSEFMSEYLSIGEELEDAVGGVGGLEDLQQVITDYCERITELRDETEGKYDNMPEGPQMSETGELMQTRIEGLEQWAEGLEEIDTEDEDAELSTLAEEATALDPGLD